MSATCPISMRSIDSNMVRVISAQVLVFTLVLFVTQSIIFASILLFDFIMRFFRLSYLSPFHIVAKSILHLFSATPRWSNEAPKRFALYLGVGISLVLVFSLIFSLSTFSMAITVILFICAALETLFDFCIGCKLYSILQLTKSTFIR